MSWLLPIRWPKYWGFTFSISPSSEHSGMVSFRIDWLISLLCKGLSRVFSQCRNLRASVLQCSAFFMVQPSHPYMTTGKTIALTIQTSVGKVISTEYYFKFSVCLSGLVYYTHPIIDHAPVILKHLQFSIETMLYVWTFAPFPEIPFSLAIWQIPRHPSKVPSLWSTHAGLPVPHHVTTHLSLCISSDIR